MPPRTRRKPVVVTRVRRPRVRAAIPLISKSLTLVQTMPAHKHNCDECVFVGADDRFPGEPLTSQVDMYVHERSGGNRLMLVRRYSSEPNDYGSWSTDAPMITKYQRVLDAWNRVRDTIPASETDSP